MTPSSADASSLRSRLDELRTLDPGPAPRIFGASHHGYTSHPTAPEELAALERRLGVRLAADYRAFLLEIGWGAGPYYGLWSPAAILAEYEGLTRDMEIETNVMVQAADPFPFGPADIQDLLGNPDGALHATWPASGAIPIGHQGCTFWSALVTTGPLAGTVWDAGCIEYWDGNWAPARTPPGWLAGPEGPWTQRQLSPLPSFREWFDLWLEVACAQLLLQEG